MNIPIIGVPKMVEVKIKVSEDVARRIMSDRQRLEAMLHGQSAIVAALLLKLGGEEQVVRLSAEEHQAGLAVARYVGAEYDEVGQVVVSLIGLRGTEGSDEASGVPGRPAGTGAGNGADEGGEV